MNATEFQEVTNMFAQAVNDKQIKLWEDPGHGWLQVPIALIRKLQKVNGLMVSSSSYIDDKYVYLEWDLDLGQFSEALPIGTFNMAWKGGYIDTEHKEDIFIRNLNHY